MLSKDVSDEERWSAQLKCKICPVIQVLPEAEEVWDHGKANGVYRKFGLCRNKLREAAMRGDVPGLLRRVGKENICQCKTLYLIY